ncbi:hypothetical protein KKP06_22075 [Ralstonia pickettii]|uniref:hypothetical protein n=1 Tax=Ralstonia pickettii TaxID=329 RepID=UPI001BE41723|nr:hypothetical protein [Ralstonia pickettii]MBT2180507.1 hypothetical protein [Ralstonia pickettii]
MKPLEYLDAAKAALDIESDYALAKHLGVTKGAVSAIRQGKAGIGEELAISIADILHIDAFEIVAAASYERAKSPRAKALWESVQQRIASGFEVLLSRKGQRRSPALA